MLSTSSSLSISQSLKDKKRSTNHRKVSFSIEANEIFHLRDVAPASTMTDEERDSAWYTKEDMVYMKMEAKILALGLRSVAASRNSPPVPISFGVGTKTDDSLKRRLNDKYPTISPLQSSNAAAMEENIDETYRGLEYYISLGRQHKTCLATRTIIEYQRKYKKIIDIAAKNGNPNIRFFVEAASKKLRYISAKCSRRARYMALVTGQSDFKAVDEHVEDMLSISALEQQNKYTLTKKRYNEASTSVGGFEMNMHRNKRRLNA